VLLQLRLLVCGEATNANIVPGRPLTLMSNPKKLILMSRKNLDINLKI
jgi:hypothetical protein